MNALALITATVEPGAGPKSLADVGRLLAHALHGKLTAVHAHRFHVRKPLASVRVEVIGAHAEVSVLLADPYMMILRWMVPRSDISGVWVACQKAVKWVNRLTEVQASRLAPEAALRALEADAGFRTAVRGTKLTDFLTGLPGRAAAPH